MHNSSDAGLCAILIRLIYLSQIPLTYPFNEVAMKGFKKCCRVHNPVT